MVAIVMVPPTLILSSGSAPPPLLSPLSKPETPLLWPHRTQVGPVAGWLTPFPQISLSRVRVGEALPHWDVVLGHETLDLLRYVPK